MSSYQNKIFYNIMNNLKTHKLLKNHIELLKTSSIEKIELKKRIKEL
jgi:hypothetical protein